MQGVKNLKYARSDRNKFAIWCYTATLHNMSKCDGAQREIQY